MEFELGVGLSAVALVIGFPTLILVVMWALAGLEAWMLQPDERAIEVHRLLAEADHPEEVEEAVAELLADVAGSDRGR